MKAPRTYDNEGFKLRAGCLCYKDASKKEILLVTSTRNNSRWVVPSGGIDPGENPLEAAIREVYEEAGAVGDVDVCVGIFENEKVKTRTYIYSMVLKSLSQMEENRERRWFCVDDVHSKLMHPHQEAYFNQDIKHVAALVK